MSIQTERFGEIADAIRSYTGETGGIAPNSFANKIGTVFQAGQENALEYAQKKAITGAVPPTATTEGEIGQLYVDTEQGNSYVCIGINGNVYKWELVENTANKTNTISDTPNDVKYPTEKAVKDYVDSHSGSEDVWEEILNVSITDTVGSEVQYHFNKRYKKIRFIVKLKGTGADSVRFKRSKSDGAGYQAYNYLSYSANLSTMRAIRGELEFYGDYLVMNGAISTSGASVGAGSTVYSGGTYADSKKYFDEFYIYLGANTLSTGTQFQIWGIAE